jgi:hypothetical protein
MTAAAAIALLSARSVSSAVQNLFLVAASPQKASAQQAPQQQQKAARAIDRHRFSLIPKSEPLLHAAFVCSEERGALRRR